jgi:hypothetical protein
MFQTKVTEKIKHILCSVKFFTRKSYHSRETVEECCVAGKGFACWITKAKNTRSECVILVAFPRQQWLRERTTILRFTYTPSLLTDVLKSCVFLMAPC